jgi:hypothetical protein
MTIVAAIAALVALAPQDAPPLQPPPANLPPVTVVAPVGPPPEAAPDPQDRVTCRTEPVVGSRFNSRVCMTQREWARRREDSQNLARRLDVQNSNRDRITAPSTGGFD